MYRGFKHTQEFKGIPAHWDKSALPELGFKVWSFFFSLRQFCHIQVCYKFSVSCALVDDCFLCNVMQRCW